jgi:hypothetical protein
VGDPRRLRAKRGRKFEFLAECYDSDGELMDLTGYTASGEVRAWPDGGPLFATFDIAFPSPGGVSISLEPAVLNSIKRDGHYDIKLVQPDGTSLDFMSGPFVVEGRVTP